MSTLGSITGHLEREQQLLRNLNTALIALEAKALGRAAEFCFSEEVVSESRQMLLDFVARLRAALDEETTSADIQSLTHRIKSGMKPLEDWKEDLDKLLIQLQTTDVVSDEVLPVLEDVLSLLDNEFTEDLRRLYSH
jgi:hypothetical protein